MQNKTKLKNLFCKIKNVINELTELVIWMFFYDKKRQNKRANVLLPSSSFVDHHHHIKELYESTQEGLYQFECTL